MQVKHLIELLGKLNPEEYVLMSSDAEGNSYHQLDFVSKELEGQIAGRIGGTQVTITDPIVLWPKHDYLEDVTPLERLPETCEDREYVCCETLTDDEHKARHGYVPAGTERLRGGQNGS